MVQINWTKQAKNDLKNIAEYIALDSVFYAKRTIFLLQQRTSTLKTNAHAGRIVPELMDNVFRELIEGNFRIVYKIVNDTRIDILTVHHSARDLTKRVL